MILRVGLCGASSRTTIPKRTRRQRQPRDQRHPDARGDQPLDGLVVVALERHVRLEPGREAGPDHVAGAGARGRRLHPVLVAQVGQRQLAPWRPADAPPAARRASGRRAGSRVRTPAPSAARGRRGTRTAAPGRTRRARSRGAISSGSPSASVSVDVGMALAKRRDRERHQRRAGRRERGHPQPPGADAEHRRELRLGRLDLSEDRLRVLDQGGAGGGRARRRCGRAPPASCRSPPPAARSPARRPTGCRRAPRPRPRTSRGRLPR